jgi:hypothetical protein
MSEGKSDMVWPSPEREQVLVEANERLVKGLVEAQEELDTLRRLLALVVNDADLNGWRSEHVEEARRLLGLPERE